jgi:hypothetical protein
MAYNKNVTASNKQRTILQRLAPVYLIEVILLYGSFFIEWRHNRNFGLPINWLFWIGCTVILFLGPLGAVYRRWIKQSVSISPQAATRFVFYCRLAGLTLLVLPFILFYMIDIEQAVGTFYAQHGLMQDEYGAHGFLSASQLTYMIIYALFALGLYLLFGGRSQVMSWQGLAKLILILLLASILTHFCLLFGWIIWF